MYTKFNDDIVVCVQLLRKHDVLPFTKEYKGTTLIPGLKKLLFHEYT